MGDDAGCRVRPSRVGVLSDAVDLVVVGAGAAGSVFADAFARAGRSVIVLEAGPPRALSDLVSSQLYARRLKWGGARVEFEGNHTGFGHNVNTGRGFGGAALHHYATWPRMHAAAFARWPLRYPDLAPYYDAVQAEVGVAGDAAAEPWRPPGAPYPLPPLKTFAQGRILARGFAKLGLPVAPLPAAILTAEYHDRAPCQYDGWCDAGCPIGALANPLVTYFARAVDHGARVVANATVTRVVSAGRDRAGGVEWIDAAGARHVQHATCVVLAASAVQNPRLLLNSACDAWPAGAGNDHGQVGRNFMLDAVALCYGLFDEPTDNHLGVSAGQLMNRVRDGDRPGAPPGGYQWQIAPSLKPNDIFGIAIARADLFGAPLAAFMTRAVRGMASMVAMIGQPPDPDNRVVLSAQRDRFGMPLAKVRHRLDAATKALWEHCIAEGAAVMKAAGAVEEWHGPFNAGHLLGGTIMGNDPATSVVDAEGRCHGIGNLVVAGSGIFPGSSGVSPTFTLIALASRSAERLLQTPASAGA